MAELAPEDLRTYVPRRQGAAARLLHHVVMAWGIAGGFVFCAIVLMSIVSIVGRKLFAAPVNGDMELLMMGAAVGSAAFLPLCEMDDHHIKVDALTTWMRPRGRAALDAMAHALLAVVAAVIAWRTTLYAFETRENLEVSALLLIPVWQPVLLLVPSFVLLSLAAVYRTAASLHAALRNAR